VYILWLKVIARKTFRPIQELKPYCLMIFISPLGLSLVVLCLKVIERSKHSKLVKKNKQPSYSEGEVPSFTSVDMNAADKVRAINSQRNVANQNPVEQVNYFRFNGVGLLWGTAFVVKKLLW
jgi:hypothetical protein